MTSVLVVAAHPDDEVLGCGGTLARHAAAGDSVDVLIVAEGATSRQPGSPGSATAQPAGLASAAAAAARALGARPPKLLGLPDNRLDSLDLLDLVQAVEAVVGEIRPEIIYTHHGGDLNVDHALVHRAVRTAARPLPGSPVRAIYAFETVSSTEWGGGAVGAPFEPTRFVDIAANLDVKLQALRCYDVEMRPFPHPRSYEAVEAGARCAGAAVGLEAAERFVVVLERVSS